MLHLHAEAIADDGRWLVATTPQDGGPVWLHAYSPRCRYRSLREQLPAARTGEEPGMTVSAGRHGVFHLTWTTPAGELEMSTVRVACS